jgi:enolase
MKIDLKANWVLDSRSNPTVQCICTLINNKNQVFQAKASVPSGASTGSHEALELRDNVKETFHGKGVLKAIENIAKINEVLKNHEFSSAQEVDEMVLELEGTENKTKYGANAILGISMSAHRAFALSENKELWEYLTGLYFNNQNLSLSTYPKLMCNIINGGEHADSGLSFQEFMVIPNTGNVIQDIQASSEIYNSLKKDLSEAGQSTALGDEGGFAPKLKDTREALNFIVESIKKTKYEAGQYSLALDCAATEFFNDEDETYLVDNVEKSAEELISYLDLLTQEYNITSIEDGLAEDDIAGWQMLKTRLGQKFYQIGDDLFVTNVKRFKQIGLDQNTGNGVLIKLNQIGSVLETCNMINLAHENGYVCAISHRSGETTDDFISDLAVACSAKFIKLGAPARGERVAKYNRLIEIYNS